MALDFCTLVGTNNPDTIHRRRWFRNFFIEPIGNPGTCDAPDEIDEPYVPSEASCTPMVSESESAQGDTVEETTVAGEEKTDDSSSFAVGAYLSLCVSFLAMMILS